MRKDNLCSIPPADGQPGLELVWLEDCQPALDQGVACAERWLVRRNGPLWTAFILGREEQPGGHRQTAFDVGFLTRLQQRLMAIDH